MNNIFVNSFVNGGYYNDKTGEYEFPKFVPTVFSKSLTDQSYFVPSKHELNGSQLSNSKVDSSAYDFLDGKITEHLFDSMVDIRNPSLDIVEKKELFENSYSNVNSMVSNDLQSAYQEKLNKKLKESKIDSLINSSNSTDNSANNSTNNSVK